MKKSHSFELCSPFGCRRWYWKAQWTSHISALRRFQHISCWTLHRLHPRSLHYFSKLTVSPWTLRAALFLSPFLRVSGCASHLLQLHYPAPAGSGRLPLVIPAWFTVMTSTKDANGSGKVSQQYDQVGPQKEHFTNVRLLLRFWRAPICCRLMSFLLIQHK